MAGGGTGKEVERSAESGKGQGPVRGSTGNVLAGGHAVESARAADALQLSHRTLPGTPVPGADRKGDLKPMPLV